jgi:hypothetical protein
MQGTLGRASADSSNSGRALTRSSVPSLLQAGGWPTGRPGRLDPLEEVKAGSPRLNRCIPLGEFGYDGVVSSLVSVTGVERREKGVRVLVPEVKATPEAKALSDGEATV